MYWYMVLTNDFHCLDKGTGLSKSLPSATTSVHVLIFSTICLVILLLSLTLQNYQIFSMVFIFSKSLESRCDHYNHNLCVFL